MSEFIPEARAARGPAALLRAPWLRLVLAFFAVYVIWGSTYLAIRFAIESIPPFFMAAARNLLAGALLLAWAWLRGAPMPRRIHWREAAIVGGFMLLGGNGGVTWSEQQVPSGLVALLVAATPLWMVLLGAILPGGTRPNRRTLAGVAVGLAGVWLLAGTGREIGGARLSAFSVAVVLLATLSWAAGSLYSRRATLPADPIQGTGMEMLSGGAFLLLASAAGGEWGQIDLSAVSLRSGLALAYLVVFGSMVAFTAYLWLLRNTTPTRAATYAYVNPVVAVLLGWALAAEPLAAHTLLAAAVILGGVALITTGQR
ncbi:MAG TPA: drug/metabolite exporter YedA [Anaerolineae bacterium]|nr:drug/metabolite exporter YedA [Anaerolineae bacterium]